MSQATAARNADTTVGKLSTLDRYLPLWIGLAMAAGLLLGRNVPGLNSALEKVQVDGISLPIAVGLLIMMYPVLAKVRYDRLGSVAGDRKLLAGALMLNWVLGPALMFTLAWLLLPDLPEYRTGLIIVGLARCIAMVIIWNDLACGDREAAAVLVALNSLFQVLAFAALGWFYLSVLPGWLHLPQTAITASPWEIATSVLIFLGIPLMAGYLSRRFGEKVRGRGWYESKFLPAISPWALYGLLFTIVILFALQGAQITSHPWDVARIALPLLAYFAIMWGGGYLLGAFLGLGYARTTTLAFTAAGNNFELAIAVAIATYGATSGQALAGGRAPSSRCRCWWRWCTSRSRCDGDSILKISTFRISKRIRPMTDKPTVLFLCTHNAGRSQMALGYFANLAGATRSECRVVPSPPTRSTPPQSKSCMKWVSISPPSIPNRGRSKLCGPPMSWSRWAVAIAVRIFPESVTRIGSSPTLPDNRWKLYGRFVTTSNSE